MDKRITKDFTGMKSLREPEAAKARPESGIAEVVADKGYHSDEILRHCADKKLRTYVSEPNAGADIGFLETACCAVPWAASARHAESIS